MSRIYFRDILDVLQGINDGMPIHPRFKVGDWYRSHLGRFLRVNKDGVLCHAEYSSSFCPQLSHRGQYVSSSIPNQPLEMGGDTEGDAENRSRSSAVLMEPLVYGDLMGEIEEAGILWPDPTQAPNFGHHTSQNPDATDELVFSLFLHTAILSNYLRNGHYAFYNDLLSQISGFAGRSPA